MLFLLPFRDKFTAKTAKPQLISFIITYFFGLDKSNYCAKMKETDEAEVKSEDVHPESRGWWEPGCGSPNKWSAEGMAKGSVLSIP